MVQGSFCPHNVQCCIVPSPPIQIQPWVKMGEGFDLAQNELKKRIATATAPVVMCAPRPPPGKESGSARKLIYMIEGTAPTIGIEVKHDVGLLERFEHEVKAYQLKSVPTHMVDEDGDV